jgi:TRAP-type C4-dicarboxylate transport system permease small subunit
MQPVNSTAHGPLSGPARADLPAWIRSTDRIVITVLNLMLIAQVFLIFVATLSRSVFHLSALMGVDELSPLFLVTAAFLGGAVAYSRGHFLSIRLLVDRLPRRWQDTCDGASGWIVIIVSLLIGGLSIPLLISNADESTVLLGIPYAWSTLPITVGSALFVIHAALANLKRPTFAKLASFALVWLPVLLFMLCKTWLGLHAPVLKPALLAGDPANVASGRKSSDRWRFSQRFAMRHMRSNSLTPRTTALPTVYGAQTCNARRGLRKRWWPAIAGLTRTTCFRTGCPTAESIVAAWAAA